MTNDREELARKIAGMGDDKMWPYYEYAQYEYLAIADFILQREAKIREVEKAMEYVIRREAVLGFIDKNCAECKKEWRDNDDEPSCDTCNMPVWKSKVESQPKE